MKSLQLGLLLFVSAFFAKAASRPNILLILVDDLKPAIGAYGDKAAITPNLDRLAATGMRFDMAYCNQAVCAPSRFTLMLGSHSTSTGLYGLGNKLRDSLPNAVTMPQFFAKHGYRTESLGKVFHIGHGNEGDPDSFSIPHFKEKVIEYVDPASTPGGKLTREEAFFTNRQLGNVNALPRGAAYENPDVKDDAYADGRVANETIARLRSTKKRRAGDGTPFFIAAGFARPHLPFSAPKKYWDLHDPKRLPYPGYQDHPVDSPAVARKRGGEIRNYFPVPDKNDPAVITEQVKRELIHGYYASVSYVDAQIGKVLAELEKLELDRNTIVVLWGDHGFHLGDLGIWTKHTNFEQANRIPIIVSAPGVTKAGSATKQLAESVDIFPTLAELAGLPRPTGPQPIDGVSLVPVLKDPTARVRDHAYHAYPKGKMGRAIRTDRFRMVEWRNPGETKSAAQYELYDYVSDPNETRNLAADKPAIVKRLMAKLAKYPEAKARGSRKSKGKGRKADVSGSPMIADKELKVVVEVNSKNLTPSGVVLAQGGKEHGYALHFIDGKPMFDVRINGTVTRLAATERVSRAIRLEATLDREAMKLAVNGEKVGEVRSPGLIRVQPQDALSVGLDSDTAAGNYAAPNPFNGTIILTRVDAGGKPPAVAKVMRRRQFETGFAAHDRALFVLNGWIRDPYIILGPDDYYYLTGTTPLPGDTREESDPYNTGLGAGSIVGWKAQVWRSRNLFDWVPIKAPFSLNDGVWAAEQLQVFANTDVGQWRLWAPELHWLGERWALVHTSPSPVKGANLSLTQGIEVKGPWGNPMGDKIKRRHDPSLFKDDNGIWWMIWGATSIAPLKADFSDFASRPINIGPSGEMAKMGHEGCLIQKIHGQYVLFGTGWSTGLGRRGSYNLYYAVADKITGPYSERKFVGRFLGHGTPFTDRDGRWWCTAFYNANIPPVSTDGIRARDLGHTAQTINQRGTMLVPLDVRLLDSGELFIRAKDGDYANPGPDEVQKFSKQ